MCRVSSPHMHVLACESSGVIAQSASCAGDARAASPSCGGPSPWSCDSANTPPIRPFGSCAVTSSPEMGASSGLGACSESTNPSGRSPSESSLTPSGELGLQYPRMAPPSGGRGRGTTPTRHSRADTCAVQARVRPLRAHPLRCTRARTARRRARAIRPCAHEAGPPVLHPKAASHCAVTADDQLPAVRRRFASVRESAAVLLAPHRAAGAQSQGPATQPQPSGHGRLNAARGIARHDRHRCDAGPHGCGLHGWRAAPRQRARPSRSRMAVLVHGSALACTSAASGTGS